MTAPAEGTGRADHPDVGEPVDDLFDDLVDDPVRTITEEVFAALVDGEPGHLVVRPGAAPAFADPLHAWVDVVGTPPARVALVSGRATAAVLTRVLVGAAPDDDLTHDDVVDALGEMANVVGGNVKGLVPGAGALSLPRVAPTPPDGGAWRTAHELVLDWRGQTFALVVSEGVTKSSAAEAPGPDEVPTLEDTHGRWM